MKYQVIAQHSQEYPVKMMCQTLDVSQSGYYAWKRRSPSQHAQADEQLVSHIQQVHQASHQIYGNRRIQAELVEQGVAALATDCASDASTGHTFTITPTSHGYDR